MKSIGFEDIVDVMLNIADPNTGGAISSVPGVSSPKINGATSIYNVEADGGIAGWSTNVSWSSSDYDTVAWSSGNVYLPDGTAIAITGGNTGNMAAITYIYYDMDTSSVATTTSAQSSVGKNKLLLCVAKPTSSGKKAEFQAFGTDAQSTFITADNIAANTITGNEIYANSITSNEIATGAVTTSKIAVAAVGTNELDDGAVTADKIYVTELSAINADLGTITAGDITGTTITAGNTNSGGIKLYPYSSSAGRIEFYYGGDMVGYMQGLSGGVGGAIAVSGDYFYLDTTVLCAGKLRIPVGTNLYN